MPKTENRGRCFAALLAVAALALAGCDGKPSYSHAGGVVDGWPVWGHSHLGQRSGAPSGPGEKATLAFEATPILANNTLYSCSPRNRIAALDPVTGKEKWMRDLKPDINGGTVIVCRGVSYWKDSS